MEKKNSPLIIGITGAFGSGKSTAADFLTSKGFYGIILSSFLEEEAKKRGFKNVTRKILQDIGNEWRENFGAGVLAKIAIDFVKKEKKTVVVVDGIRNVSEIEKFQKNSNFILIGIVSDRKVRFERLRKFKRRENLTWKSFKQLDYRDLGVGEKETGLQVAICLSLSDLFFANNKSKEAFIKKLNKFLSTINK